MGWAGVIIFVFVLMLVIALAGRWVKRLVEDDECREDKNK